MKRDRKGIRKKLKERKEKKEKAYKVILTKKKKEI